MIEIRVNLDDSGQYQLQPRKDGEEFKVYMPDLLGKHGGDLIYVFEDPQILRDVVQSVREERVPGGVGHILQSMQRIRLCIFELYTKRTAVTAATSKDLDHLLHDWYEALQLIPAGHNLHEIQFDLGLRGFDQQDRLESLTEQVKTDLQAKTKHPVTVSILGLDRSLSREK